MLNLQEMHYIFTPNYFFPGGGGMPSYPLSYGMSDVNPHLTLMWTPTLRKGWIRPWYMMIIINDGSEKA